jgi:hypothetical protein
MNKKCDLEASDSNSVFILCEFEGEDEGEGA